MEKNLENEILSRNFKKPSRFCMWLYHLVMYKFVAKQYNCKIEVIDDINKEKGPCFVIFNHLSRLDHIFVTAATYPKRYNMLCAYNEFFRSHLAGVFKIQNVLPKKQFSSDIISIKAMSKIFKQNGCVAIAPEGIASLYGESHPVIAGTGKLFKHFNVPVYFAKLRGQHLTTPWFNPEIKKGECTCTLSKLYSVDDIKNKSAQDIEDELNELLYHDEFEFQKQKRVKWEMHDNAANNLEDFCYECPKCHKKFSLKGEGNIIKCNHCGNTISINEYYDLIPEKGSVSPSTITDWVRQERHNLIKEIRDDENYSYSFKCQLGKIPKTHFIKDQKTSEVCGEGTVTIDHAGFHYIGSKDNNPFEINLNYTQLYTLILTVDTTYFSTYVNGEYFDFYPENKDIVGYLLLLVEEMHRLHVNSWKNYPKYNYMYE